MNHALADLSSGALPAAGRRRWFCVGWLAGTLPAGLIWRFAPLHLSPFAYKYGGSALWATAVYWIVAILLPRGKPALLAFLADITAVAVECFKLVPGAALDRFRDTLAGKVLLGRYFTKGAIAAYLAAILAISLLDRWVSLARPRENGISRF